MICILDGFYSEGKKKKTPKIMKNQNLRRIDFNLLPLFTIKNTVKLRQNKTSSF